jgi:4-hydroxy-tetrahydrodipicolinate synthase
LKTGEIVMDKHVADPKETVPPASLPQVLTGILPPTTMPFDRSGELVYSALREQIDFVVAHGARGVVAGGSTGEGQTLGFNEFVKATHETHAALAGRLPLVVGVYRHGIRTPFWSAPLRVDNIKLPH